ncbi:crosslink repair DNA glycosylase YcaQ family protein [Agrococcus sp. ARC_14]|uniref:DNA glycosylase AlkZ-like family protein n=1 Tax=Agrococcus sp. ARC_14 TaxID=2919927 RepID=UPI001F05DCA2|nr:crosslink repair DNA glycosylase YcaQ family protein [Agrococcus sp. ARC_14]MCH1883209.1 winged helix DNA-binding domain-containing protein [Agrococcus sp. ARC_14]
MAAVRTISIEEARRIAVRAQWLDASSLEREADDLPEVVEQLTLLPLNPTEIVAPSAEQIAHTRIPSLAFDDVRRAVETEQTLFEHLGPHRHPMEAFAIGLRAMTDLPWTIAIGRDPESIHSSAREWLDANGGFHARVLMQLREEGPLPQAEIDDAADVPYASSGWNTDRNVAMMLELLQIRGEVVVAERHGTARVWDLAARVLPPVEPARIDDAWSTWRQRWLRSNGITRPTHLGDEGESVRVEASDGTMLRGEWRLAPDATAEGFAGRVALLSPLDRLIADRKRMTQLWGFEYALEQYTPAAKRRWGAFALPILDGDLLVGKVDAKSDRESGALLVHRIHWDTEPSPRLRDAVHDEIARLAAFLSLRPAMP